MMLTLYSQVKPIHQLAEAWGDALDGVSLKEWTCTDENSQSHIIIQYSTSYAELSRAISDLSLSFISNSLLSMSDDRERSVYFFIDEVSHLRFTQLPNLLSLGRSKGAKIFLGVQDLGLLSKHFSKDDIQAMSSMISTLIVLRVGGLGETISSLSKALGMRLVERLCNTFDYRGNNSFSWQAQTLAVVPEADIAQLPQATNKGAVGFLSIAGTNLVAKLLWPLCLVESRSDPVALAAWAKSTSRKKLSRTSFDLVEDELASAFDGEDHVKH